MSEIDTIALRSALEAIGTVQRRETPDYAEITSPAFQMMCVQPDAVMLIFHSLPALLDEIDAKRAKENSQ